ncbi:hypothetical protein Tco_1148002, partial [Tanacetum coccineum]
YGYIKNHKKTIKNGQARTREQKIKTSGKKENTVHRHSPFTPSQKREGFLKLRAKNVYSSKLKYNGRVIKVKSRDSLAHSQSKGHVINGRSTKRCGFCTKFTHTTSTSEPQTDCQLGNPCELTSDPTAIKLDQMIAMIGWQRLKEVGRGSGPRSFFQHL